MNGGKDSRPRLSPRAPARPPAFSRDASRSYEAPTLTVVGTLHELTQYRCVPIIHKTIGPPDYFHWIPIANCSP